jgi:hypothetical protein
VEVRDRGGRVLGPAGGPCRGCSPATVVRSEPMIQTRDQRLDSSLRSSRQQCMASSVRRPTVRVQHKGGDLLVAVVVGM